MAAEYILSEGNYNVILCERGVRTFSDFSRNTLDLAVVPAVKKRSHLPILVDPSHGTGKRHKVLPLSRAAVAVGADGLLVEVHHQPEKALSDGMQSILPEEFAELLAEVRSDRRRRPPPGELTCPSLLRETISAVASSCKIKARKHAARQKLSRLLHPDHSRHLWRRPSAARAPAFVPAARAAPECLREHGGREHNGCGPHRLAGHWQNLCGSRARRNLEHPKRHEVWGVSSGGGYVWVIDTRSNQITARIAVGGLPYSIEFSSKGDRAYTTASGADQLIAIDCATRAIVARAKTGSQPVQVRITPDNKFLLVVQFPRRDARHSRCRHPATTR